MGTEHLLELLMGLLSISTVGLFKWVFSTSKRQAEDHEMIEEIVKRSEKRDIRLDAISDRCAMRMADYARIDEKLKAITENIIDVKKSLDNLTERYLK